MTAIMSGHSNPEGYNMAREAYAVFAILFAFKVMFVSLLSLRYMSVYTPLGVLIIVIQQMVR
jgi:hypothetical protein